MVNPNHKPFKDKQMKSAAEKYEHASMILTGLETDKSNKDKESKEKISNKLDKVYMSLIDLYL